MERSSVPHVLRIFKENARFTLALLQIAVALDRHAVKNKYARRQFKAVALPQCLGPQFQ